MGQYGYLIQVMVSFDWFVFRPLYLDEFISYFKFTTDQGKQWYDEWSHDYNRLAKRFYIEQYNRHKLLEFREFSSAYSLNLRHPEELDNSSDPEYYYEAWKTWKDEAILLQQHRERMEKLIQQHPYPSEMMLVSESIIELLQQYNQEWGTEQEHLAKALWFNSNITLPSADELAILKSLPYPSYLKTSHWKKVRAAMMLIEQARCKECMNDFLSYDSFYGGDWETEIQVHHLHYRNRGHERYEDLHLLCRKHHEAAHNI